MIHDVVVCTHLTRGRTDATHSQFPSTTTLLELFQRKLVFLQTAALDFFLGWTNLSIVGTAMRRKELITVRS